MSQTPRKNQYAPIAPIDPTKRARAIREAVRTGKIKRSKIIDDILVLLDEIVTQEAKTA